MRSLACLIIIFFSTSSFSEKTWNIYIDADYSNSYKSSFSIELGLRTALQENQNMIAGRKVKVIPLDHRANSRRSLKNLKAAIKDPNTLAVFSGKHSPPILANKEFINNNQLPFLIPWAAAGPTTRSTQKFNSIFRLSIDDSKAGKFIVSYGQQRGLKMPLLILEDTGWGKSNYKTITKHLEKNGKKAAHTLWFKWRTSQETWQIKLREAKGKGAPDHIIFVGNGWDGQIFMKAFLHNKIDLPILSHWGITGADFVEKLGIDKLKQLKLKLKFIQSDYQLNYPSTQKAIAQAKLLAPDFVQDKYVPAPAGFIHSFDLTKILIAAAENVPTNSSAKEAQLSLIKNLENLQKPISGLIQTYETPFSPYSSDQPDAHEALGYQHFRMGHYNEQGRIVLP